MKSLTKVSLENQIFFIKRVKPRANQAFGHHNHKSGCSNPKIWLSTIIDEKSPHPATQDTVSLRLPLLGITQR